MHSTPAAAAAVGGAAPRRPDIAPAPGTPADLPVLNDPDNPPRGHGIHAKMAWVMGQAQELPLDGHNAHSNYRYPTAEATKNAVRPLLLRAGIMFLPSCIAVEGDAARGMCRVKMEFRYVDVDQPDSMEVLTGYGQAEDTKGPKALAMAITLGIKKNLEDTFLMRRRARAQQNGDGGRSERRPVQADSGGRSGSADQQQQRGSDGGQQRTRRPARPPHQDVLDRINRGHKALEGTVRAVVVPAVDEAQELVVHNLKPWLRANAAELSARPDLAHHADAAVQRALRCQELRNALPAAQEPATEAKPIEHALRGLFWPRTKEAGYSRDGVNLMLRERFGITNTQGLTTATFDEALAYAGDTELAAAYTESARAAAAVADAPRRQ